MKLGLTGRLVDVTVAEDVVDPMTGEVLAEKDSVISREQAKVIENAGVEYVMAYAMHEDAHERVTKVIGSRFVDISGYVGFDTSDLRLGDKVY